MRNRKVVISSLVLTLLAVCALVILVNREPADVRASDPTSELRLAGVVRDFRSDHTDFGITDSSDLGHYAWNLSPILGADARPYFVGGGSEVDRQWFDKYLNPIAPYASDRGLPGGHFDVDVFDEATDKELYHQHEFDDKFDVTYVDVAHDARLLYNEVIGSGYPNDLRLEFFNPHNSSGVYTFQAGGDLYTGNAQAGFTATFSPGSLTQLRVDFAILSDLRGTKPGNVQDDVVLRDGSFAIRMYDTVSNDLVYELAVYEHISGDDDDSGGGAGGFQGNDTCGDSISDELGKFSGNGPGAITDADSFGHWYRDVLGTNLSKMHVIKMVRNGDGVYEYLTDEFFPIDGQLFGNEDRPHNNLFTFMIAAEFVHASCAGYFFEFEGDDDCWVFIDGKRVIDLGGVDTPDRQYIALDRLDLVDGEVHKLNFYVAHRRITDGSVFRMRTNIPLCTPNTIPVTGGYD